MMMSFSLTLPDFFKCQTLVAHYTHTHLLTKLQYILDIWWYDLLLYD